MYNYIISIVYVSLFSCLFQDVEGAQVPAEGQYRVVQPIRPAPDGRGHPVRRPQSSSRGRGLYEGTHEERKGQEAGGNVLARRGDAQEDKVSVQSPGSIHGTCVTIVSIL